MSQLSQCQGKCLATPGLYPSPERPFGPHMASTTHVPALLTHGTRVPDDSSPMIPVSADSVRQGQHSQRHRRANRAHQNCRPRRRSRTPHSSKVGRGKHSTSITNSEADGNNVPIGPTGPPATYGPSGSAESDGDSVPHRSIGPTVPTENGIPAGIAGSSIPARSDDGNVQPGSHRTPETLLAWDNVPSRLTGPDGPLSSTDLAGVLIPAMPVGIPFPVGPQGRQQQSPTGTASHKH